MVPFLNESRGNAIAFSTRAGGPEIIELNQIAFLVVSTDKKCPWDNSIVFKPNASGAERIWNVRRQRDAPAPHNPGRASRERKKNRLPKSKWDLDGLPDVGFDDLLLECWYA